MKDCKSVTPSPWMWAPDDSDDQLFRVFSKDSFVAVAKNEADAQLIAAAPAMRAELRRVLEILVSDVGNVKHPAFDAAEAQSCLDDAKQGIRAALALGEKP